MPLNESMRAHNREVMAKIARNQVYPLARKEALAILDELGMFVKSWIASKTYTYEDQTYNLTDSTGCAIYENGKLVKFMPYVNRKQASRPRTITYHGARFAVDGRALLRAALSSNAGCPLGRYGTFTLAVISTAPYGVWVNEGSGDGGPNKRGRGWFDELRKATEQEIIKIKAAHGYSA